MRKQTIREWAIATFGKSPRVIAQYVTAIYACNGKESAGVLYNGEFYGFGLAIHLNQKDMIRVMKQVTGVNHRNFASSPIVKVTSIKCELLEGE